MAVAAVRIAELDGFAPIDEERQLEPTEDRIEARVADLVEVARIKTLDDMGEGSYAIERTKRWLRSRVPANQLGVPSG